ncbi:unnamed protein product [Paramecium primaurelia]|uniref:ABC transporter domain-containing protein n=1 Tax=Paramecium primaurelia TaxID=5886 RepID=A0A8S1MN39_PARPR|nr:unnamed protein product [Paramecium primaurelia]
MSHLTALLKKNYILWKRNCCCSVCEILLPLFFIGLLLTIRQLFMLKTRVQVEIDDIPESSYLKFNKDADLPRILAPNLNNFPLNPNQDTELLLKSLPQLKNCIDNRDNQGASYRNGLIGIGPEENEVAQKLSTYFVDYYGYQVKWFKNNDEIDNYVRSEGYNKLEQTKGLCLAIMFETDDFNLKNFSYSLRFNTSDTTDYIEYPLNRKDKINSFKYEDQEITYLFYDNGFLTIQNWIDNLIIQKYDTSVTIEPTLSHVRSRDHIQDKFPDFVNGAYGIYLALPLMIVFLRMTHGIIYEKEKKLREGMKIMGLSNTQFYLSWIIQYLLIYGIISALATAILKSMILPESSWGFVFLNYYLFCLVLIVQSLFLSVFFSQALTGLIVSIVWYLLMFLMLNLVPGNAIPTRSQYWGVSFSSQASLAFSFGVITLMESQGNGFDGSNLTTTINNYSISIAWTWHIINIIAYLILAIYLDQVFPNEWGVKKHPLFFISWIWEKNRTDRVSHKSMSIERMNTHDDKFEEVEQALKEQEQKNEALIIKGLCRTYPNGKQAVSNLNLSMYQGQIFALLGHNGAGKTSTISMLTGLLEITKGDVVGYGFDVKTQLSELRKIMGVCPQHDILFDNLTVKEHLELFAQFKGIKSSEIQDQITKIIADVDLTDKTDYLSKNLSGGQKRRLSVAIAFIGNSKLVYLDEPTSGMDTSARRYIWEMLKNYKDNRIIVLTTHFMDEADFLGDRIGIMGEGKLLCSGSSVFLKNRFGVGYNLTLVKDSTQIESQPIIDNVMKYISSATILSNVSAEVVMQLPIDSVDKFPNLFEYLDKNLKTLHIATYGISITTLEEVFLKVAKIGAGHEQVDDVQNKEKNDEINQNVDLHIQKIEGFCSTFFLHLFALMQKRFRIFKRDIRGLICEIFVPILVVISGLAIMTVKWMKDDDLAIITPQGLYDDMKLQLFWGGNQAGQDLMQYFSNDDWNISKLSTDLEQADKEYFDQFELRESPGWYFFNQFIGSTYSYWFLQNSVFVQSSPLLLNQMNQAILRKVTNTPSANLQLSFYPFPQTQNEKSIDQSVAGYLSAFIFSIGFAFIPASIISFIVKEREINIKHQQLVSGVSVLAYWASNWIIDIVKHLIPAIVSALMVLAFDIDALILDGNYGAVFLFFILYGWAIIPFSYVLSFFFKVPGNSLLSSFFIHLVFGSIISIVIYVFFLIESTRDAASYLVWIFRPIPSFSFALGLLRTSLKQFFELIFQNSITPPNTFAMRVAGEDLLVLAISGVGYMIIVFILEFFEDNGSLQKLGSNEASIPYKPKILDDDVEREQQLCQNYKPQDQAILVRNLRKVFMLEKKQHKVAVDNISFSVGNGEVFSLLGVNGAGKTTTFKILSGELKPTSGIAYVSGHSVIDQIQNARKNIGYCPQFDALLDNLTVCEHLELFAKIKGITNTHLNELVEKKMVEMDLKRFESVEAGQLSGGNKRKLSVAIAMIGNPPIVFLDEPSTGMDPEARRFMWNVISRISTQRKQSSIILTTHSMEEAEALSTKIAIQVDGNLRCFGSVQHVKNKYGQGYEVEIKLQKPQVNLLDQIINKMGLSKGIKLNQSATLNALQKINQDQLMNFIKPKESGSHLYNDLNRHGISVETLAEYVLVESNGKELLEFIQQQLGQYEVIEHFQTFYRIRLLSNITAGKLFSAFEKNKQQLTISQYSIKQASIEQIFNIFAKQDLQQKDQNQEQVHIQVQS